MGADVLFGELRSILQEEPSEALCMRLGKHLDLWGAEALEAVALPYLLAHLRRWPAELGLRVSLGHPLYRWVEAAMHGAHAPPLLLVTDLDLGEGFDDDLRAELATLLRTPYLERLRCFRLLYGYLYDEGALALATSPHLRSLVSLELFHNWISDVGVAALAASPNMDGVTRLDLGGNDPITAEGVGMLARSPHLSRLEFLSLQFIEVCAEGARALAASPHMSGLRELWLTKCMLGDEGAAALLESPYINRLEQLRLGHNGLTDATAELIAASPHLVGLTCLDLGDNALSEAGILALASSPHLRNLTALHLYDNEITDEGAAALASSPYLHESIRIQWRR